MVHKRTYLRVQEQEGSTRWKQHEILSAFSGWHYTHFLGINFLLTFELSLASKFKLYSLIYLVGK